MNAHSTITAEHPLRKAVRNMHDAERLLLIDWIVDQFADGNIFDCVVAGLPEAFELVGMNHYHQPRPNPKVWSEWRDDRDTRLARHLGEGFA